MVSTHYNPSCKESATEGPYLYDPRGDYNKLGALKKSVGQYSTLLHIMCGYQCDKAVNKNDTREVI